MKDGSNASPPAAAASRLAVGLRYRRVRWRWLRPVRLTTAARVFRLAARRLWPRPIVRRVTLIALPRSHDALMPWSDEKREARPVRDGPHALSKRVTPPGLERSHGERCYVAIAPLRMPISPTSSTRLRLTSAVRRGSTANLMVRFTVGSRPARPGTC